MQEVTGQCLCGAVSYKVTGEGYGVVSCHCKDCQRLHGIYNPMYIFDKDVFSLTNDEGIAWYDSSEKNDRGYCKKCGSALFMRQKEGPKVLISAGSLDDTTELKNVKNIFTEDAGNYYDIPAEHSE